MLDGHFHPQISRVFEWLARPLAAAGVTPNQVTLTSTVLLLIHAALFLWHRDVVLLGVGIALLELLDYLDGALARLTDASTALGAWLDALTDRYKEVAVLAALGQVYDLWALAFAAITGSLITSYVKARAGQEVPISNWAWPDLFERTERIVVLVAGCVVARVLGPEPTIMAWTLGILGVGSHLTALQRSRRAVKLLRAEPSERAAPES